MDFRRTAKLKYRSANNIFYRILNVSYIFTYNSWIYCECDKFQGCVTMDNEKCYCYISCVRITDHISKIKNLNKISDIINIYLELKEDLKKCIDFNRIIKTFWLYHYKTIRKDRFGLCKWIYLKDYFDSYLQLQEIVNDRKKLI